MLKEKISKIEFIDLQAQRRALGNKIPEVLNNVLEHGRYVLGPEVIEFEEKLTLYTGALDTISCSDGTDALRLLLQAYNVGPGDAVFVPTFTFAATAEVVAQASATPVFVDVCPDTFNLDVESLKQAIESLKGKNLHPKGIIAVDIFGMPADYAQIHQVAEKHGLWVISDAAQSFGGAIGQNKVGTFASTTTTSFFPSKPLACYGDGGAIFTTDPEIGQLIRSLRNHGCGKHRYDHVNIGFNSRLDTMQAAILIEKLRIFPLELIRRNEIATLYSQGLKHIVQVPQVPENITHAWGLYSIVCQNNERETLIDALQAQNIPTNVYYRKPLHLQPAYAHFPRACPELVHAEKICNNVLSLPMHPYLTNDQVEYVVDSVKGAI